MLFRQIGDPRLAQYAYLIGCQRTGQALIVDPERDVDRYIEAAAAEGLELTAVTETHIHADFLSGSRELVERIGAHVYLSAEGGDDWQYGWAAALGDGVTLLSDGDRFKIGGIELQALHTPGHTPEHLSFLVTDRGGGAGEAMGLLSGDFVFVGDLGRPDLLESAAGEAGAMEPSAHRLYDSVQEFLELPDFLQIWPAHGAGSACGKALGAVPASTVGYERRFNVAIDAARRGEEAFVDAILDGQPEPPYYFARMKRQNRDGVPLLGSLPTPPEWNLESVTESGAQILDSRDRRTFMGGHLPGSLLAPLDRTFPTVAGSYVDPERDLVLVVEPAAAEDAIRSLVRIGLDRIVGLLAPAALEGAADLVATPTVDFAAVAAAGPDAPVLDVRGAGEYAAGHVPGALHIAHTRLRPRLDEVPDGPLFVHCQSGIRAAVAAAFLESNGREVSYVDDGFPNWRG